MSETLENLTSHLIEMTLAAGADQADALAVDSASVSIDVRHGALEHAERSESVDVGIRAIVGQKQSIVSSTNISPVSLRDMAERVVEMARLAPDDPWIGLADPDILSDRRDAGGLELFDPSDDPLPRTLEQDACAAESAALDVDGVTQVEGASAGYGRSRIWLTASNGFAGGYERTSRSVSCSAISGEGAGMERDGAYETRIFQEDLPSPDAVGTRAGQRCVARAGARKPQTGSFPVLYDERVSASLIGHLLSATNGATIARGSSWARELLGEQVLPETLNITEDPLRLRAGQSRPFDAEGLPATKRRIVDKGVLTGWTLDLANARKLGMTSTASAARGTGSGPSPATSNIELTAGSKSPEELLKDMGTGLLVTSMIGSTINPTTGDYSRGAYGFWIENGEIQYPVNECTIAGNLKDMLKGIIPANDAETHKSHVVPSLLVPNMTIAGA